MEISAYVSMLQSHTTNPATVMSQPSLVSKDMLNQLSNMSTAFERAFKGIGNPLANQSSQQMPNWTAANGPLGHRGALPGPARINPVPSSQDSRIDGGQFRVNEQQMIQAALNIHKSILHTAGVGATVQAASSGSQRSTQNIDTLIRGQ